MKNHEKSLLLYNAIPFIYANEVLIIVIKFSSHFLDYLEEIMIRRKHIKGTDGKIEVCGTKVRSELKLGNVNVRPAVSVKLTASHNVVSPGQEQTKQTLWVAQGKVLVWLFQHRQRIKDCFGSTTEETDHRVKMSSWPESL